MKLRNRRRLRNLELIVAALSEGWMTVDVLAEKVHRSPGLLYPDLAVLERGHRIESRWGLGGRRQYRTFP